MGTRGPMPSVFGERARRTNRPIPIWAQVPPPRNLEDSINDVAVPKPPVELDEEGEKFWNLHAPFLIRHQLLDKNSESAFLELCITWSRVKKLRGEVDLEGVVTTGKTPKLSPKFRALMELDKMLMRGMDCFGLTPVGRQRLGVKLQKTFEEEFDPFA